MSIRSALQQSAVVTFGVAVAGLWLLLTWLHVFETIDLSNMSAVGTGTTAGIVGLGVLTVTLGLLFVLFGELGQSSPGPKSWPPSE